MALDYDSWVASQPEDVTGDPLWGLELYRRALYLLELAGEDVERAWGNPHAAPLAGQLVRAVGSVSASLAEGYGRTSAADRMRFLGHALGSIREAEVWYRASSHTLADGVLPARLAATAQLRRMLLGLINRLRSPTPRPTAPRWPRRPSTDG